MVHIVGKRFVLASAVAALFVSCIFAQDDPPSRVARLNYMSGNVSMEPAGVDDWAPAVINRPFTTGDYLYTDQGSQAELHMDVAAMRMGSQTSFGFLNLNDQTVQIKLSEGDMYFHLHDLDPNQVFEVDTPNAAVNLLRDGIYRFRVDANGNMSFVVVRQGQAEITGGGQAFTLNPGNSAMLTGTDQLSVDVEAAPAPDDFDNWCAQRDAREERSASAQYLPPTVVGTEDLDDNGDWQTVPDYGPVWYPRSVAADWAPYHYGHWAWIDPWGWTWVDDMRWGFAPFHYGRWAYIRNRWGWCPGPIARVGYARPLVRPYYAPALVAWFGGAHWGVPVLSGGGPSLGWVPLGFGEVFTPSYRCSERYFNNVNVYNTRVDRTVNITNVYNTVYVNHTVYSRQFVNVRAPNAVVAMPQAAFASGRPVREAGIAVRQAELTRIQPQAAAVIAPPVVPTRQAFVPTAGRPAPHPPAPVLQRPVVARTAPPPALVPVAAQQAFLQQHPGQPFDYRAMHQATGVRPAPEMAVRPTPAAQPVQVHAGQRFGNPAAAANRPGEARPAQVQSQPAPAATPQPVARQAESQRPEQPRPQQPALPQVRPQQTVAQPAPAAPGHGTPPNMRPGSPVPVQDPRFAERTPRPAGGTAAQERQYPQRPIGAPASQPATQPRRVEARPTSPAPPQNQERIQAPQPPRPAAESRPAPQPPVESRPAPPAQPPGEPRPTPPQPQPRLESRPTPQPQPRYQERPAPPVESRPVPQPRLEPRPAPPPQPQRQEHPQAPQPRAEPHQQQHQASDQKDKDHR